MQKKTAEQTRSDEKASEPWEGGGASCAIYRSTNRSMYRTMASYIRHVSPRVRRLELPPILYVEEYEVTEGYTWIAATLVDACLREQGAGEQR